MVLSFRTDMPGQTVQTQIRLLLEEEQSDLGLHYFNSVCIFWVHYSLVKPSCSNVRLIRANVLGVGIFRIFMVIRNTVYNTKHKNLQTLKTNKNGVLQPPPPFPPHTYTPVQVSQHTFDSHGPDEWLRWQEAKGSMAVSCLIQLGAKANWGITTLDLILAAIFNTGLFWLLHEKLHAAVSLKHLSGTKTKFY